MRQVHKSGPGTPAGHEPTSRKSGAECGLMLRIAVVFSFACLMLSASAATSMAGGWSGADGEALRAQFRRGYTLDKLWMRLGSR